MAFRNTFPFAAIDIDKLSAWCLVGHVGIDRGLILISRLRAKRMRRQVRREQKNRCRNLNSVPHGPSKKYAGRVILDINTPTEINSTERFRKLNCLPFSDRFTFLRAVLMFKCLNNATPPYLSYKFHKLRYLHNISTHQATADHLSLPNFKLATTQNSLPLKERNYGSHYLSLSSRIHHFPSLNVIF